MLQNLRSRMSIWLALVAACFLVLQVANGANAASSQPVLDVFGNPLCLSGRAHDSKETAPASDHDGKPECCTLACGAFAFTALSGRVTYVFDRPLPAFGDLIVARDNFVRHQLLEEFLGSPRAPPRLS